VKTRRLSDNVDGGMAHVVGRQLNLLSRVTGVRIPKFCFYSTSATTQSSQGQSSSVTLLDESYPTDGWTNISNPIKAVLPRKLYLKPSHPIGILRNIIEARFPSNIYTRYADLSPIVSLEQNFDSLGIPVDHPSRSKTDTYYVNSSTVLRTHSSAHQADIFRTCPTPGFLISTDVYRRDEIDRNHYPAFHQMEGAMTWNLNPKSEDISAIQKSLDAVPKADITVEDSEEHFHTGNPLQAEYSSAMATAVVTHLKRTLEDVVQEIFHRAHINESKEKVKVRWIDAYFPFTSPSYELEVFWEGSWLELLGCGVVTQKVLGHAGSFHLLLVNFVDYDRGIG
jgi:phenylalanyl-tRNA synthetase alpha chain